MGDDIRHCFIDLDGVLVDFVSAALAVHGRDSEPVTQWNFFEPWGITASQFWKAINDHGDDFWADLNPYPWMSQLLAEITVPFTISTTPSLNPASAAGKVRWMRKHLGSNFRDYLIGPQKHLLARYDTLLIDDSDDNVQAFREAGGQALLFPQPWNENRQYATDGHGYRQFSYVVTKLAQLRAVT